MAAVKRLTKTTARALITRLVEYTGPTSRG